MQVEETLCFKHGLKILAIIFGWTSLPGRKAAASDVGDLHCFWANVWETTVDLNNCAMLRAPGAATSQFAANTLKELLFFATPRITWQPPAHAVHTATLKHTPLLSKCCNRRANSCI